MYLSDLIAARVTHRGCIINDPLLAAAAGRRPHKAATSPLSIVGRKNRISIAALLWTGLVLFVFAKDVRAEEKPAPPPEAENATIKTTEAPTDERIGERITAIFSQIDALTAVKVSVQQGVVTLAGQTANETQARRAVDLAQRTEGVVTVQDHIERTLDIHTNLTPLVAQLEADLTKWFRALPLVLLAIVTFSLIAYAGHRLALWSSLWQRLAPNSFLAELIQQAVRIAAIILALILALNLLGATALMGTIIGGAGVLGLALGFAVRDALDNYISSIMLSLRQPFRANDHVLIDAHEGKVVRLTSRATVLMTLDGNHLRIPNATVFKAVILNYTRNPERRLTFELGIDAADDPLDAIAVGVQGLKDLDFILRDPKPLARIETVGDSNIVLHFSGWVNQEQTDFYKARSLAIRAVKNCLEANDFTLPEPIYRLRFDKQIEAAVTSANLSAPARQSNPPATTSQDSTRPEIGCETIDVRPERHLDEKISEERHAHKESDLLDGSKPEE